MSNSDDFEMKLEKANATTSVSTGEDVVVSFDDELVDLDALFDVLNIAASDSGDAIRFQSDTDGHGGGVVTVTQDAFSSASGGLNDLASAADEAAFKDSIASDES